MSQSLDVRNLQHSVELSAPPEAVYAALMDAQQHASFTGFDAEIDAREGGAHLHPGGSAGGGP
jgi:uncharacterized protein YndB with AHSA1/START domain